MKIQKLNFVLGMVGFNLSNNIIVGDSYRHVFFMNTNNTEAHALLVNERLVSLSLTNGDCHISDSNLKDADDVKHLIKKAGELGIC